MVELAIATHFPQTELGIEEEISEERLIPESLSKFSVSCTIAKKNSTTQSCSSYGTKSPWLSSEISQSIKHRSPDLVLATLSAITESRKEHSYCPQTKTDRDFSLYSASSDDSA